jgi:hypothetical protein
MYWLLPLLKLSFLKLYIVRVNPCVYSTEGNYILENIFKGEKIRNLSFIYTAMWVNFCMYRILDIQLWYSIFMYFLFICRCTSVTNNSRKALLKCRHCFIQMGVIKQNVVEEMLIDLQLYGFNVLCNLTVKK